MKKKVKQLDKKAYIRIAVVICMAILAIYSSFVVLSNLADISRLKATAAEYDAQYNEQVNENEKVKEILNSKDKDAYIEQKAREKGYVKDGEIVFYDISSSK